MTAGVSVGRGDGPSAGADRCLLTGGTGFVGSHLAEGLADAGYRVRCLVRRTSDTARLRSLGVELVTGDITDAASLRPAAEGCRFVVHCAALVSDWGTVQEIRQINVAGTRNILEASASAAAQRFIHLSTTDVYGYPGATDVEEDYLPCAFSNWYAESKRAAEAEVRYIARARGLETVILRPASVYGPFSEDVVGELARAIRAGQMILVGGGRANAGLVFAGNVADAALLALRRDAAAGEAFNVTDGLAITWRRFLSDIAAGLDCPEPRWRVPYRAAHALGAALEHGYRLARRATGLNSPPLLSRQAVHVLGRDQSFSNRKARAVLGWEPRVSYAAGLEATLAWLREDYLARAATR